MGLPRRRAAPRAVRPGPEPPPLSSAIQEIPPGPRVRARQRRRRARRRGAALAGAAALVAGGAAALIGGLGGGERAPAGRATPAGAAQQRPAPPPPPELPRGGRSIFPEHRVVAFYGAPQSPALGALGIGTPARAARRLERQMRAYRRGGRTLLPALELIATIASGAPYGGRYSFRQDAKVIRRYLRAARKARALLVLDVQPGRSTFMREVRALRRWLREPDVGLALDPEWRVGAGQIPGRSLGSVDASAVNRVQRRLSRIVRRHDLPSKLLVVHQFTESMLTEASKLRRYPGVELVLNADGVGGRADKIATYGDVVRGARRFHTGFKLFYEEDSNLLSPRDVLALEPRPDLVVYE